MEIKIGQIAIEIKKFDKERVQLFAELTGDYNPIHFDEVFAEKTIFKKPIVHGPLVLTLITTLFAKELPGPGSVYLSHDIKFISPVYYDDVITAILEVTDISSNGHVFINTICKNQNGEIVIEGNARLKIMI
ncbi:MaoC family dehydratase [Flavobacterium luteum]|uniref:MaoC family dehydratase n=1 Tax=Flavobacterium luteum TaxID=2026654 RepID=A0A7J5AE62_9FLAO|nr:MaoC family dehydratase [Flavobacterium luteum]KAB1155866.1 MaoC family dehydratase [Flavobacterium luteum]